MAVAARLTNRLWKPVLMGSAVTGGLYFALRNKNNGKGVISSEQRMTAFNQLSKVYDKIAFDDWFLRMGKYRERLINQAQGRVLEVAVGTGPNLPYYVNNEKQISEVHFVDKSPNMMQQLENKPIAQETIFKEFLVNDCENLNYENDEFDCVIDTFGMSEYENPDKALNEMIRVGKPGSKLLLLEHGPSNWSLVQLWQKRQMLQNVKDWSHYLENRNDIEIQKYERKHFGTTYYIEAVKTDGKSTKNSMHKIIKERKNRGMDINVMVNIS